MTYSESLAYWDMEVLKWIDVQCVSMSDRGSRIQALMSPFFALKSITPLVRMMLKYFSELAQSLQRSYCHFMHGKCRDNGDMRNTLKRCSLNSFHSSLLRRLNSFLLNSSLSCGEVSSGELGHI